MEAKFSFLTWVIAVFLYLFPSTSLVSAWVLYPGGLKGGHVPSPTSLDIGAHDVNEVYLMVSNQGMIGLDAEHVYGAGFFPRGTSNNYVFGTGLWLGGIADIDGDGDPDTVFTQGYNPIGGDSEFQEGRIGQSPSDPLARVFNSLDPLDLLEWPPEFGRFDPGAGDTVPLVYSVQDLVTLYNAVDRGPIFGIGNLPIEVHQRSMAFIGEGIGQAIYFVFDLVNASGETPEGPYTIEDAWLGYDSDMDVGVVFSDDIASVLFRQVDGGDTLILDTGMAWDADFTELNFTGIPGFVGIAFIQSPGDPTDGIDNDGDGLVDESPWNGLDDDGDGKVDEPDEVDEIGLVHFSKHCNPPVPCEILDPQTDEEGYDLLACDSPGSPVSCLEDPQPADIRFMVSSGPFDWPAGETVRFVVAFVFSEPVGSPTHLDLYGDPPRPDPNDQVLADFVSVIRTARAFWSTGIRDYETPLTILETTDLDDTNDPMGPYEVQTSVADSVGIASVSLFYSVDEGPFVEVAMEGRPISSYTGDIPGQPFGAGVRYYIQAVDSLYLVARDPEDAPLETYNFEVVDAPTFTDMTDSAGIAAYNVRAAVWFDYDRDGDEDLYIGGNGQDHLYRNDGGWTFSDVTEESGIGNIHAAGARAADYDNDGDLDLYVASEIEPNRLYRNEGDGSFAEVAEAAGVDVGIGSHGAVWGDYDRDGDLDLFVLGYPDVSGTLFRNLGDGTFEDVTTAAGLGGIPSEPIWAAVFFDRDLDGDLDLYLVADGANILYDNDGDGTFTDRTAEAGLSDDGRGQDMALGDYDRDGDLDLFVLNGGTNCLFRNDGDGTFTDVADLAGVADFSSETSTFADVNKDGYADLLLSHIHLLINNGDGTFTDRAEMAGLDRGREVIAPADVDRDGWVDLFMLYLYRNDGYPVDLGRNQITVRLEGTRSPRDGTGAVLEAVTALGRQAWIYGGGTGRSMGSLPVEIGLDTAQVVDTLVVRWTSGIVQELTGVPANQELTVVEDSTLAGIGDGGGASQSLPRAFSLSQNYPNPFNPSTTVAYAVPAGRELVPVRLFIYDVRGRLVKRLVDGERAPGRYRVHWDGRDDRGAPVSSGVYLYRIEAADFVATRKMLVVR